MGIGGQLQDLPVGVLHSQWNVLYGIWYGMV